MTTKKPTAHDKRAAQYFDCDTLNRLSWDGLFLTGTGEIKTGFGQYQRVWEVNGITRDYAWILSYGLDNEDED